MCVLLERLHLPLRLIPPYLCVSTGTSVEIRIGGTHRPIGDTGDTYRPIGGIGDMHKKYDP